MSSIGSTGMQGPVGETWFKMAKSSYGEWTDEHVQFQNLCLKLMGMLNDNHKFGDKVTITRENIVAENYDAR